MQAFQQPVRIHKPARLLAAIALALAICLPLSAGAEAPDRINEIEGITEYRLQNGLQVLLLPDASKAVTTVNLTVLAGSRHENYGETGMAHLLEHLVFKGSARFETPAAEMARRGLRWNGTTSDDRTNYFATFASSDDTLDWYLKWAADAFVNSRIDRKDLDSEMTVVRNEMERGENHPEYILLQKMQAAAFQWHNYGKAGIGARSDVENVSIERLRAFYRRYYRPDNAVLIVTGRFDPKRTLDWIEAAFGGIPRPLHPLPAHYTLDPPQDGERQVTVRRTGDMPMVAALYHGVPAAHPDYPAMTLLANILGSEPEGRLYKTLSEKKLAVSTLGWAVQKREPGYILFGARLGRDMQVDAARKALLHILDAISTEEISDHDLAFAKLTWRNHYDQMLSDPTKISFGLSEAAASGDWRLLFLLRDRIEAATLDDVRRVAKTWLVPDNRTVGVYIPTDKPQRAPAPAFADAQTQLDGYRGRQAGATVKSFDATLDALDETIQSFTLDNGMKIALLPKETRGGKVNVVFTMRYGTEQSLAKKRAASHLARAMLDRGTRDMSRIGLAFRIMSLGLSSLNVNAGRNYFTASFEGSGDKLQEIIPFMLKVLREPSFPEDEFDKLKQQMIANLERRRGEPDAMATLSLDQAVNPYPEEDIRAVRDIDRQIADIKATTLEDAKDFHREFFGASHAELVLVGAFDPELARAELSKAFGDWNAQQPYRRIDYRLMNVEARRIVLDTPDKKSATYLADLGIPFNDSHPDVPAMLVANRILGGGADARLARVRQKEGLSYRVASFLTVDSRDDASRWRIYASFAPENRQKLEQVIAEELQRLNEFGAGEIEVKSAVDDLLARMKLARAEDPSLAFMIANNLELGRNFRWQRELEAKLRALGAEDVNRVIRQWLKPQQWVKLFAGDFGKAK